MGRRRRRRIDRKTDRPQYTESSHHHTTRGAANCSSAEVASNRPFSFDPIRTGVIVVVVVVANMLLPDARILVVY